MNSLVKLKKNRYSGVKKKCLAQKFSVMVHTNTFLLFFHYNGTQKCNWERIKKKIREEEQKQQQIQNVPEKRVMTGIVQLKGLVVPSNLHSLLQNLENKDILTESIECCRFFIRGPTLVVACSSSQQLCVVATTCFPPTFTVVGGLYNQSNILSHLDIKQWVSLSSAGVTSCLIQQTACVTLLRNSLRVLYPTFLHPALTLLHLFQLLLINSTIDRAKRS